jgi:hypothetical protein
MSSSDIETTNLIPKYIIEAIGHALDLITIFYGISLGEYTFSSGLFLSTAASTLYHLCQLGLIFHASMLPTLRFGDYNAILMFITTCLLRYMNLTYRKPTKAEKTDIRFYKQRIADLIFSIIMILAIFFVINTAMWISFSTPIYALVMTFTMIIFFYMHYVKAGNRLCLDGKLMWMSDLFFGAVGLALLWYGGNPGDSQYWYIHGAWHIVADLFKFLFLLVLRIKDHLSLWPRFLRTSKKKD